MAILLMLNITNLLSIAVLLIMTILLMLNITNLLSIAVLLLMAILLMLNITNLLSIAVLLITRGQLILSTSLRTVLVGGATRTTLLLGMAVLGLLGSSPP